MTPGSSIPYSQDVKSPFLPDLKPNVSSLHPSSPGECCLALGQVGRWVGTWDSLLQGPLQESCMCRACMERRLHTQSRGL